jgi:alkylated DNA nucleotide flippase Atl1
MQFPVRHLLCAALLAATLPALGAPPVDPLDAKYGVAAQPAYIKHYEADRNGKVLINPYLQVASPDFPAVIDPKGAPYNWVIDAEGRVGIIQEAAHPLGRTYEKGFFRPEDQSQRKPGTTENYGHVSALAGAPGRISGEILYDKDSKTFIINNKSGRYSKHNFDRTPEQLVEAAKLIRAVVDTGKTAWGPVYYLLEYSSKETQEALIKDPRLAYDDPKKKSRPHVEVMAGGPSQVAAEAPSKAAPQVVAAPPKAEPAMKAEAAPAPAAKPAAATAAAKPKKAQAAQNDDPS